MFIIVLNNFVLQIVVEADLGSDLNNLVALDDLRIITENVSA